MSYTPPLNGGRINATIGGNTAGASTLVSSGTLTLAGGNNITLSQNGNAITISGGAGGAAGSQTLGMSNLGNTVGTSGVISGSAVRMLFAGGNNVTLSQSTNASSATITISAAAQSVQTQNRFNMTLTGNTSGVMAQVSSGTLSLAGGNNITLSQNGNAVTISGPSTAAQTVQTQNVHNVTIGSNTAGVGAAISSGTLSLAGGNNITLSQNGGNALTIHGAASGGGAGTNTLGMSNLGNTSGTSGVITGSQLQLAFAGGDNVTLSQSINGSSGTISFSAANQTVQTQSRSNMTIGGNTAGVGAAVSSGSLTLVGGNNITLSQNGNAITISAPSGGGGADGYNDAQFTNSTANTTMPIVWAGNSNGSGNITMGLTGSTVTASAAAGGGASPTGSYFDNMFQQNSVQGISYSSVSTGMFGRVIVQPLAPGNELFPFNMTASTLRLNFSNSGSSNLSAAHTSSYYFGLYTRVNSTQLSLVNSVMQSIGMSANASNSSSYMGARWLSAHSSQFSTDPVLEAGKRYFFAILARTSGASYASISMAGMHLGQSVQRSGYMGTASSGNTSFNAWHPFMGVHSLTTHTALPATIGNADINKASVYANFIPQIIFDAGLGAVN